MKNRKTVIVAFMLAAVLLLSVGYAAVTNVLDITGSVTVSQDNVEQEFNADIYFEGVVLNDQVLASVDSSHQLGYTANINTNNNDKAQFTITGIAKTGNDEAVTYRIKNDSELDATVKLKSQANTNENDFSFDYYFGTEDVKQTTIPAGGTVDVTVEVALIEQLSAGSSASFVIELDVTAG